jgi:hypothetical protein
MARFLQIAVPLKMSLFNYPVITPLPQVCWILQIYLSIHRAIGGEQNP